MKSIRHFFLNLSMRTKFLLMVFVSLFAVFSIPLALARMPYRAYDRQLYESSVQTITLFAEKLESQMDEISELSYRILADNGIQKNLPILYESRVGSADWSAAHLEISQILSSYAHSAQDILSLGLYGENRVSYYYAFGADQITSEQKDELIRMALESNGREQWMVLPGTPVRPVLVQNVREARNLSLRSLSVEIIVPDFTRLVDRCSKSMEALGFPLSLAIYAGDACVYASDEEMMAFNTGENGYSFVQFQGSQALCVRHTSSLGWAFVTVLPYDSILAEVRSTTRQAVVFSLIVFLSAALICAALIYSIVRQLNVLLGKFDAFAGGEIPSMEDSAPYLDRKDEIGRLYLLLTDVRMPGMDGLELVERARTLHPHLLCIVLSGYDEFDYARRALHAGVVEYLLKPCSKEDMEAALEQACERLRKQNKNSAERLEERQRQVKSLAVQLENIEPGEDGAVATARAREVCRLYDDPSLLRDVLLDLVTGSEFGKSHSEWSFAAIQNAYAQPETLEEHTAEILTRLSDSHGEKRAFVRRMMEYAQTNFACENLSLQYIADEVLYHEAAIVDGAGPVKRFFKIVLPMITPIFFFNLINQTIGAFQAFNSSYLITQGKPLNTSAYALKLFSDTARTDFGATFAMSVLSLIPILVIFFIFQKQLVEGISTQGLKG